MDLYIIQTAYIVFQRKLCVVFTVFVKNIKFRVIENEAVVIVVNFNPAVGYTDVRYNNLTYSLS